MAVNGSNINFRGKSLVNAAHYSQGSSGSAKASFTMKNSSGSKWDENTLHGKGDKIGDIFSEILGNILSGDMDSDRLLIIALMFILIKEGADKTLILALGYILL